MKTMILSRSALASAALASLAMNATADTPSARYVNPILPVTENVHAVLTVGDSVGGYRMVGIPDGMGAYDNGNGTFTLLMNHELNQTQGVARAHGGTGAFVSQWVLEPTITEGPISISLDVQSGVDAFSAVKDWDDINGGYVDVVNGQIARLCAAYLAGPHGGFDQYMFLTGEETGNAGTLDARVGGQAFAVFDGTAWALPRLGRFPHENQVVVPGTGEITLVVGLDDGPSCCSQVYFTVGQKVAASKDPLERNGLSNGLLYVMKVQGITYEDQFTTIGQAIPFTMELVDWTLDGNALETASDAVGGTKFARVEDGEYDPNNYNDFYFDTTGTGLAGPLQNGRFYRITFNDLSNPLAGGTITMLLDGTEGMISPDNIGINGHGQILLNEDPNYPPVGRDASVWLYDIPTGNFNRIMEFDTALATSIDPGYFHGKWETSGVMDATEVIGDGWWIFNVQAHYNITGDPELVQGGQLLVAKVATELAPGDTTGNGIVNVDDLLDVINAWGPCPLKGVCVADQDDDGDVDVDDLLVVINNWG